MSFLHVPYLVAGRFAMRLQDIFECFDKRTDDHAHIYCINDVYKLTRHISQISVREVLAALRDRRGQIRPSPAESVAYVRPPRDIAECRAMCLFSSYDDVISMIDN